MKNKHNHAQEASTPNATPAQVRIRQLKLGVDSHADHMRVARRYDGQSPQPARRFSQPAFLEGLKKQKALADKICLVYEAAPGGLPLVPSSG